MQAARAPPGPPLAAAVARADPLCGAVRFGALDFAVDQEGTWRVLEINPNGQWGWIAYHTGLPIASAIADALCNPTHREE